MIVVDRVEGNVAVLEVDGTFVDFPLAALPEGTREGDRLTFTRTPASTDEAAARLERLKSRTRQGPGEFDL